MAYYVCYLYYYLGRHYIVCVFYLSSIFASAINMECLFSHSPTLDLESSQKHIEAERKAIDELIRERDILNKVCLVPLVFTKSGLGRRVS